MTRPPNPGAPSRDPRREGGGRAPRHPTASTPDEDGGGALGGGAGRELDGDERLRRDRELPRRVRNALRKYL